MCILAISVSLFSILGAVNIVFRVPDFFRYEFDRGEISSNLSLGISGTELGSFFSQFMSHKHDAFSLITNYEGEEQEIFNKTDDVLMTHFRVFLDVALIFAIVALIATAVIIFALYYMRRARSLRTSLNIGLGIYIASIIALILYFDVYSGDVDLLNAMLVGKFSDDDLLMLMFDDRFVINSTIVVVIVSFIIMMIIRYIVWRMTAQKGIFSDRLKGIAK